MARLCQRAKSTSNLVWNDVFRQGLLDFWEGRCAITGLAVPELLRASHIKPWAACETDTERLDIYNGHLLAPNLDAAFDRGFINVADSGEVIVSPALDENARQLLGLGTPPTVRVRLEGHRSICNGTGSGCSKGTQMQTAPGAEGVILDGRPETVLRQSGASPRVRSPP